MANAWGKSENGESLFSWAPKLLRMVTAAMKLKDAYSLEEKNYDKPRQCIKKQRHHFGDKGPYSQSYGFSSSHVRMWELDHKESWVLNNWCFQISVLEKTWESLGQQGNQTKTKRNQPWIFIGRTDAEAPILWPPDGKGWLTGKDWGQEEKGATEDELVGWHHQLDGHEFEQNLGDSEGQGSLACYSPRGHKEL